MESERRGALVRATRNSTGYDLPRKTLQVTSKSRFRCSTALQRRVRPRETETLPKPTNMWNAGRTVWSNGIN
jgi:hypothetical protein